MLAIIEKFLGCRCCSSSINKTTTSVLQYFEVVGLIHTVVRTVLSYQLERSQSLAHFDEHSSMGVRQLPLYQSGQVQKGMESWVSACRRG
jgi:hypothetical protein